MNSSLQKRRLDFLIARLQPSCIALVRPDLEANERIATVQAIVRFLRVAASSRSISIVALRRKEIRAAFMGRDVSSKDKIASMLASLFPELGSRLPPERKIWTKEYPQMALFDAVSGAIAYCKVKFGIQNSGRRAVDG